MENKPKCVKCGGQIWTVTKITKTKSYSPVPFGTEKYKWVELDRKEEPPKVECSKCGGKEAEGYDIKVEKRGKGFQVLFQTKFWDKFS